MEHAIPWACILLLGSDDGTEGIGELELRRLGLCFFLQATLLRFVANPGLVFWTPMAILLVDDLGLLAISWRLEHPGRLAFLLLLVALVLRLVATVIGLALARIFGLGFLLWLGRRRLLLEFFDLGIERHDLFLLIRERHPFALVDSLVANVERSFHQLLSGQTLVERSVSIFFVVFTFLGFDTVFKDAVWSRLAPFKQVRQQVGTGRLAASMDRIDRIRDDFIHLFDVIALLFHDLLDVAQTFMESLGGIVGVGARFQDASLEEHRAGLLTTDGALGRQVRDLLLG